MGAIPIISARRFGEIGKHIYASRLETASSNLATYTNNIIKTFCCLLMCAAYPKDLQAINTIILLTEFSIMILLRSIPAIVI